MRIEIVTDHMPPGGRWIGGNHRLQMGQKIFLGARGSTERSHDLSADHIPTQDEGACAMANILKLASLNLSRSQRQPWVFALESLYPGQFIGTHGAFSPFGPLGSLLIHLASRHNRFLALRINRWGEPIADQVRLEIPFFSSREACRGEMCWIIPRRCTSSAISRPVQWLMGRSFGCSH